MTKKVAVTYPTVFESVKDYFALRDVEVILTDISDDISNYDLTVAYNEYDFAQKTDKVINIHPSLLPAFANKNAIKETFDSGVKVGGVTIHSKDKIIAQYPVLIGTGTHIDDYMAELFAVEKKLLPPVIDALLCDRVFDFADLFLTPCRKAGGCSGCGGCH